jgi:hypothetical protein
MWATGELPLFASDADADEVFAFISENRPQHFRVGTLASQTGHQAYERLAAEVKAAFESGLRISDIRSLLEIAIDQEVIHDGKTAALRRTMPRWDYRNWKDASDAPADDGAPQPGGIR